MPDRIAERDLYPLPRGVWWVHVYWPDRGHRVRFWREAEGEARELVRSCQEAGVIVERVLSPEGEDMAALFQVSGPERNSSPPD